MCVLLCEYGIYVHLGREYPYRSYPYLALFTPSWDPLLGAGSTPIDDTQTRS